MLRCARNDAGKESPFRLSERVWVPAFAGKAEEDEQDPLTRPCRYFPQRGKIISAKSSPSGGSGAQRRRGPCAFLLLFPAKAGTQTVTHKRKTAHRAKANQGIINSGPCQPPGLLRCARNDAKGLVDDPLPRLRRYFPQRGKIINAKSSPSGRSGAQRRRGPRFFPLILCRAARVNLTGQLHQTQRCRSPRPCALR